MGKPTLEFINIPKSALETSVENRITDWREEGRHLLHLYEEYEDQYRKKICSKCNVEQQVKRGCIKMYDEGKLYTYCDHMERAKYSKYRYKINQHIDSHPAFFTSNLLEKTDSVMTPAAAPL